MASILGIQRETGKKIAVVRSLREPTIRIGDTAYPLEDLNPTLKKFNEFWDLMETVKQHGYLRAAMSVVGRSAVGAWWTLRQHPEYKNAPERHRKRLLNFYYQNNRTWDNIKDFYNIAGKLMIGVMYLRYFGQAAYYIIRDESGTPIGLDFLHGLVVPNVDKTGKFKSPAFAQYPSRDPLEKVEFTSPKDLVYLVNPDWEGSPLGGTDIEALTRFTLPIDLYLQLAAREYLKNRDTPEVVYSLPADISEDAFDSFVKEMEVRRRGPTNVGRNPIAVQGEFEIKELRPLPDALPYQESRKEAREEELAVAGVSGAKLGITDALAAANIREMRREFHETALVPLFKLIEVGFYEQVHVREFNAPGWQFQFDSPDFLNAVERATVHMRYHDMGVLNPNEIRSDLNLQPRDDEFGDKYVDEKEEAEEGQPNGRPGSPPEGREVEPDDPSQTGEPTLDDQDPPRGDQHDEQPKENLLAELRQWKKFAVRRMKSGKSLREFNTVCIPEGLKDILRTYINQAASVEELAGMFEEAISHIEED